MRLRRSEIVVGFLHYLNMKKKKKKDGNIIIDKYKLNEKNLNCSQTNLDNNNNNQNKSTKHRKVIKETRQYDFIKLKSTGNNLLYFVCLVNSLMPNLTPLSTGTVVCVYLSTHAMTTCCVGLSNFNVLTAKVQSVYQEVERMCANTFPRKLWFER